MIEICKFYKKVDKNGVDYFVADAGPEASYLMMPIRSRGNAGEPSFRLMVRSKEQRNAYNAATIREENKGNK